MLREWASLDDGVEQVVPIVGGFPGRGEDSGIAAQGWWCDAGKYYQLLDRCWC